MAGGFATDGRCETLDVETVGTFHGHGPKINALHRAQAERHVAEGGRVLRTSAGSSLGKPADGLSPHGLAGNFLPDALLLYAMTLQIFQSSKTPAMFGFTIDPTGANLPAEDGPWERAGDKIPLGITMASTSPKIAQEIERKGFALIKGHTAAQPRLSKGDIAP